MHASCLSAPCRGDTIGRLCTTQREKKWNRSNRRINRRPKKSPADATNIDEAANPLPSPLRKELGSHAVCYATPQAWARAHAHPIPRSASTPVMLSPVPTGDSIMPRAIIPSYDPQDRLERLGPMAVKDAELLGTILGKPDRAEVILSDYPKEALVDMSLEQLLKIEGLSKAKAKTPAGPPLNWRGAACTRAWVSDPSSAHPAIACTT